MNVVFIYLSELANAIAGFSGHLIFSSFFGWTTVSQYRGLRHKTDRKMKTTKCVTALVEITKKFILSVECDHSITEMIASGQYDWHDDRIANGLFLLSHSAQTECEACLFNLGRGASSEEAIKTIAKFDAHNPWTPAHIGQLLSFGAKYPEEQRKHQIVGLGSTGITESGLRVPYLGEFESGRKVYVGWWNDYWRKFDCFLAVRTLKP